MSNTVPDDQRRRSNEPCIIPAETSPDRTPWLVAAGCMVTVIAAISVLGMMVGAPVLGLVGGLLAVLVAGVAVVVL